MQIPYVKGLRHGDKIIFDDKGREITRVRYHDGKKIRTTRVRAKVSKKGEDPAKLLPLPEFRKRRR